MHMGRFFASDRAPAVLASSALVLWEGEIILAAEKYGGVLRVYERQKEALCALADAFHARMLWGARKRLLVSD